MALKLKTEQDMFSFGRLLAILPYSSTTSKCNGILVGSHRKAKPEKTTVDKAVVPTSKATKKQWLVKVPIGLPQRRSSPHKDRYAGVIGPLAVIVEKYNPKALDVSAQDLIK